VTLFDWEKQRTKDIVASMPEDTLQHVLSEIVTHRSLIDEQLACTPVVISFGAYQITVNSKQHLTMLLAHHRVPITDTEANVDNTKQQKKEDHELG